MRHSRKLLVVCLAALASTTPLCAEEETSPPTTTTEALPPPPTQETTARGTLPDLEGRWLAVGHIDIPGGRSRTNSSLLEIGRHEGKLDVTTRLGNLPPALQAAIDRANGKDEPWTPTADDLSHIAAQWDALSPRPAPINRIETTITARDAFDDVIKGEPRTKDALWVLQQSQFYDASAAPTIRQVLIYAVLEERDGGFRGNYTSTVLAATPFPIPISFNGSFDLYRLGPRPRRGLGWLLDLFSGCGRRRAATG